MWSKYTHNPTSLDEELASQLADAFSRGQLDYVDKVLADRPKNDAMLLSVLISQRLNNQERQRFVKYIRVARY